MLKRLALFAALLILLVEALPRARKGQKHSLSLATDLALQRDEDSIAVESKATKDVDLMEVELNTRTGPWNSSCNDAANKILDFMAFKYLTPTGVVEVDEVYESSQLSCGICTKAVGFAVPKIAKFGCGFLFKAEAAIACFTIGLGPEDPLSYVCSALLIGSCKVIAGNLAKKVTDPNRICQVIKLC